MSEKLQATPAWMWGDSSIRPEDEATVRAGIAGRFEPAECEQVLSMLFDPPQGIEPLSLAEVRGGQKLPDEAKAQIRELVATGMSDEAIADQLGVSRQGVSGVRTHAAKTKATPAAPRSKGARMSEKTTTGDAVEETTKPKPKRGPAVAPTASGRTKAQLAVIREWAIENGVRHTVTGRMPRATIEAYDAAHATSSVADLLRAKRESEGRELFEVEPDTVTLEVEVDLSGMKSAIADIPVTSEEDQAWDERGKTDAEADERWHRDALAEVDAVQFRYDTTLIRAERAETALELALRAWDAERTRRRGQSALLRSMARQVILAEQERRYDADVLEGMDRALASAYETIQDLRQQLEQARATPAPWWKRAAS